MRIEFVSGIALITPDPPRSRQLYVETLGLPLAGQTSDGYLHSEQVPGTKHFGLWPVSQAAEACFGDERWPAGLALPQVSVEFDVADVAGVQAAADSSSRRDTSCCTRCARSHGDRRWCGCSRPRGRSSASPTCRRCTDAGFRDVFARAGSRA